MDERLLVIHADAHVRAHISSFLQAVGCQVLVAGDGREGLRLAYECHPELVILGLALPDMGGCEICGRLRELSNLPILMLAKGLEEEAVVACLQAGADDCLGEPVRLKELEARVRALLRRVRTPQLQQAPEYDDGSLRIESHCQLVWRRGSPVHLSPTESRLLDTLLRNQGKVVTHEDLLAEVWSSVSDPSPSRLSVYVHDIREKLEDDPARPQYVQTAWGVGYFFAPNGVWGGRRTEM